MVQIRRVCIMIAVVLATCFMLVAMSACGDSDLVDYSHPSVEGVSDEKVLEMRMAYFEQIEDDFADKTDKNIKHIQILYSLGTYNDCIVVKTYVSGCYTYPTIGEHIVVGDVNLATFSDCGYNYSVYTADNADYSGDSVISINKAYEDGLITVAHLEAMKEVVPEGDTYNPLENY